MKLIRECYFLPILKFRCSNHNLPVEKGRWENIEHSERKCTLCQTDMLVDEFRYLFECSFFNSDIRKYLLPFYTARPNTYKFNLLFNSSNIKILKTLSLFISLICKKIPSVVYSLRCICTSPSLSLFLSLSLSLSLSCRRQVYEEMIPIYKDGSPLFSILEMALYICFNAASFY